MKNVLKYRIYFSLCVLFLVLSGCATSKKARNPEKVVTMDITIQGNDPDLTMVNLDVFKFKILDELEDFQTVDLTLADEGEDPKLMLNINIDNFMIWPKDERRSTRTFRRHVAVGTDANNRPVYQVVTASADITQVIIRTSATFNAELRLTDTVAKPFNRSFSSRYNWTSRYVSNIRGDSRAIDAGLYSYSMPPIEPITDDILLVLATREMTKRLSNEIRSYFRASKYSVHLPLMTTSVYKPFDRFTFDEKTCYLTGKSANLQPVFPAWVLNEYGLGEKLFKYLDERVVTYNDIKAPVSAEAEQAFFAIDRQVKQAFDIGFEAVTDLEEIVLFQWMAKLIYGTIHTEIRAGIKQQRASGEAFNFSQSLSTKFSNLHLMLQSIITPIVFEGVLPWSIKVFKVDENLDTFSYRDEINTLVFSVRAKDFGIIACLQDNGESLAYHQNILDKIGDNLLHPIQWEEICARFFYSAYLFNRLPEYTVLQTDEAIFIESMPLRISSKPVYDEWQVKTYGQVLENFWKPWNILLFEIIKNPQKPLSFLINETGEFNDCKEITFSQKA